MIGARAASAAAKVWSLRDSQAGSLSLPDLPVPVEPATYLTVARAPGSTRKEWSQVGHPGVVVEGTITYELARKVTPLSAWATSPPTLSLVLR